MDPTSAMSITPIAATATKATCCSVMENEKAEFLPPIVVDAVLPGGGAGGAVVVLVCMPDVEDVDCPVLEEELVEEAEVEVNVEVV